jgi:RNA polymerase sigma-70 factor (ECF subfamily)
LPTATLAQRIVRAKRKIRDAGIPLSIPVALDERIDALLAVLYLVFNEGYLSRGAGDAAIRVDLVDQALRLTQLAASLMPANAEVQGLLALELYTRARIDSRLDGDGDLVLLEDQDRSRWDLESIRQANAVLATAMARMHPGPYQVQAVIAGQHANARTAADTDWPAIVRAYDQLLAMTGSPVVALNRAAAVAMADGPGAGLALLGGISGLDDYHLLHSTRAELAVRAGDLPTARVAFGRARALTDNPAELRHLDRRIASLG